MSKLEGIVVAALIQALKEIGETFFDGDDKDNLSDIINALLGIFGLDENTDEDEVEE